MCCKDVALAREAPKMQGLVFKSSIVLLSQAALHAMHEYHWHAGEPRGMQFLRMHCMVVLQVQQMRPPDGPLAPGSSCACPPPLSRPHSGSSPGQVARPPWAPPPPPALEPPVSQRDAPGGVAKKPKEMRDVHISVALMEDFLRCALTFPTLPARQLKQKAESYHSQQLCAVYSFTEPQ